MIETGWHLPDELPDCRACRDTRPGDICTLCWERRDNEQEDEHGIERDADHCDEQPTYDRAG